MRDGEQLAGNFYNRSLRVWHMFRSHFTNKRKEDLKEKRTKFSVIPESLTSILQLLDVSLDDHSLKQNLRDL